MFNVAHTFRRQTVSIKRPACGAALLLLLLTCTAAAQSERREVTVTPEALEIHGSGMLFDGHNDLPWEIRSSGGSSFDTVDIARPQPGMHTDIPRLRQGGVKAQFWSVYVPASTDLTGNALLQTLQQDRNRQGNGSTLSRCVRVCLHR
jgi:membrane dipeptidase